VTQAARGSGGAVTPGYLDDGSLANVGGAWRMQFPDGSYAELNFGTDLPIGVCAPLATTTSADGPVSAITWGVAGCASLGDQSCDGDLGLSGGTGCVAIDTSGSVLVATVQLGGCTPAAWPAVNFAAVTQTAKPTKAPTKAKKLPLCKKETRSTKKHPCRTR
jgi:hypothetical protein